MKKEKIKIDREADLNRLMIFKHILEGSELYGVNVFVIMKALGDAIKSQNMKPDFFKKRLKLHSKKMGATLKKNAEDYKKISSFIAEWESAIRERRGIYAA
ncbi:MAG: hypothetical protein ACLP9S_13795 [Syntrophales bacterium]